MKGGGFRHFLSTVVFDASPVARIIFAPDRPEITSAVPATFPRRARNGFESFEKKNKSCVRTIIILSARGGAEWRNNNERVNISQIV